MIFMTTGRQAAIGGGGLEGGACSCLANKNIEIVETR